MNISTTLQPLRNIPKPLIFLCLVMLVIPNLLDDFNEYYIDEMAWFLLLFPCFIFSFYLGFKGGLCTAIIVNAYHMFLFLYERYLQLEEILNQELALHVGVAVVTSFSSIGVGILSEKLKDKQQQLIK